MINSVALEVRWQELRVPHGTGPRTHHARPRDMFFLKNGQRLEQLLFEEILTQSHKSFGGQRAHRIVAQFCFAKGGFPAPD